ncbi:MAG: bifunctional [glutamate--ammonia ligase]-adenylyl-L-tyrosine phosphorylase/[glutamate--ammonia-ligase] adenylyltransferase [Gammaproteobacteria bacterium]|nr:bifunctional [glutamate--ammonia ligase]-adenylyl-L-tyrosine phosphorylase/[glutamate--ammonia-ligase] adenylyltransferase [Gammaproteobacteria bacterium]
MTLGLTDHVSVLPAELSRLAGARIQACIDSAAANGLELPEPGAWPGDVERVFACSEFVAAACEQFPQLLSELLRSGELNRAHGVADDDATGDFRAIIDEDLGDAASPTELMPPLRRLRRREWIRIAWRDIGGLATLEECVRDTSGFAGAAIDIALKRLHKRLCDELGTPSSENGDEQHLTVIALGKLGAGELNFSSDIDLIFAFPSAGGTKGKRRELSNDEFFQRLARNLIKVLGERTEDGFVFRVDMRLRPFGTSGPLVMSFGALEDYYALHGRDWERYALIRARPVAGDVKDAGALLERLRPFIYRRYLDFGALESMRDMKSMINKEVERKGLNDNLKLGPGGIREIEFTGQAFQMVRGGRIPELRDRRILRVLDILGTRELLPTYAVTALTSAYRFLRTTEHRLQQMQDRQRHELPNDEHERLVLAAGMGYSDWPSFAKALARHRERVNAQFTQVLGAEEDDEPSDDLRQFTALLSEDADEESATAILEKAGFSDWRAANELIDRFRRSYSIRLLDKPGRARLKRLFPDLLRAVAAQPDPIVALERILEVIEAVARRSAYLALLSERPLALSQLVQLCAASPWISRHLGRHPLLFDELLDARSLYAPLKREALKAEIAQRLDEVAAGDTEQEMAVLRQFKQTNVLRVAAADVAGAIPLMVVSDYLSEIAETVVNEALRLAGRDLIGRYGRPVFDDRPGEELPFAVVAYGKLGGLELGYGSDLDLVFIHGGEGEGQTDGARSVDNSVFFGRLAQRTIHFLTAMTGDGALYEVDSRLRPDGTKGLLVNRIDALERYLREEAWTWEHQALVRARAIAGDPALAQAFARMRQRVLTMDRDVDKLKQEVRDMRERMRRELGSRDPRSFDIKQDVGGIADIEFMVQYGALCWARRLGDHLNYTDNIRLLEGFAAVGVMPDDDIQILKDAYRAYRSRVHQIALQEESGVVSDEEFKSHRNGVQRIWAKLMEG